MNLLAVLPIPLGASLLLSEAALAPTVSPVVLGLPIACSPGGDCFVQQYFDHDPGPGAKDYRCGARVYDGHDGVDIRLPSIAAQKRGVAVLAAAGGIVRNLRNDMPDQLIADSSSASEIKGRECGNGVVIVHGHGWETQYCHMAHGSIVVVPGQVVKTGDRLGLVGLSGQTQFPHLHFAVRVAERKIDPFLPDAQPGQCSPRSMPGLWTPAAAAALAYRDTEVINTGFADAPIAGSDVENAKTNEPSGTSPSFVAFARAIGLQAGDAVQITVRKPDGATIASNSITVDRAKAQFFILAGRKRPPAGWQPGRYAAHFSIVRGGRAIIAKDFALGLGASGGSALIRKAAVSPPRHLRLQSGPGATD